MSSSSQPESEADIKEFNNTTANRSFILGLEKYEQGDEEDGGGGSGCPRGSYSKIQAEE